MLPFFCVLTIAYTSFSTADCLYSDFDSILEKNTTGCLSATAIVLTSKRMLGFTKMN